MENEQLDMDQILAQVDALYEEVCALVPIFHDNQELMELLGNPQIVK